MKSIADLPNVHYLILCDRENVEKNLIQQGFAGNYLEKIVQFGAPLPTVPLHTLSSLLVRGVSQIFKEYAPADHRIDDKFLDSIKDGILPAHFTTLRNIKRFLGDLRLSLPIHCQNGFFELNPYQHLFLTACRLLCPKGVELLASQRAKFIYLERGIWLGIDKDEHQKNLSKFIEDEFPKLLQDADLVGFDKLFGELLCPLEAKMLEPKHALENRLIHSSMWFDSYFTLERPQRVVLVEQAGELSKSITREISETCLVVKRITDEVGYTPLLRYLVTAAPSLFCDESSNLMTALLSNEENPLCEDPDSDFFESNIFESFLYWLRESPDKEHQKKALKMLKQSENYRFFSLLFYMLGGEVDSAGGPHRILRQLEKPLGKATAAMIEKKAAEADNLIAHYFGDVHDVWQRWGKRSKLTSWIKTNTETAEQFISYLRSLGEFRESTDETHSGPKTKFRLRYERLATFPSIQTGIKRCKDLLDKELISPEELLVLEAAQNAFRMAAIFRKGQRTLPKELPEWVGARFSNEGKLNLPSHYLFIIPCVGPNNSHLSKKNREQIKNDLAKDINNRNIKRGILLIKYLSSQTSIAFLVQAKEDDVRTIAKGLNLDAYFILRDYRQVILKSTENKGCMNLGTLSELNEPNS